MTRPSFQSTENAEKSDVTLTYTLWKTFFFPSPQRHDRCLQTTRSRAFSNEGPVYINPAQFDRIKSITGKRGQGFTVFVFFSWLISSQRSVQACEQALRFGGRRENMAQLSPTSPLPFSSTLPSI